MDFVLKNHKNRGCEKSSSSIEHWCRVLGLVAEPELCPNRASSPKMWRVLGSSSIEYSSSANPRFDEL